jgi:hypothetical protein
VSSPFLWRGEPSSFTETAFTGYRTTGKTKSQTMAEVVERKTAATGRNPGTIQGLSDKTPARAGFSTIVRKKRG